MASYHIYIPTSPHVPLHVQLIPIPTSRRTQTQQRRSLDSKSTPVTSRPPETVERPPQSYSTIPTHPQKVSSCPPLSTSATTQNLGIPPQASYPSPIPNTSQDAWIPTSHLLNELNDPGVYQVTKWVQPPYQSGIHSVEQERHEEESRQCVISNCKRNLESYIQNSLGVGDEETARGRPFIRHPPPCTFIPFINRRSPKTGMCLFDCCRRQTDCLHDTRRCRSADGDGGESQDALWRVQRINSQVDNTVATEFGSSDASDSRPAQPGCITLQRHCAYPQSLDLITGETNTPRAAPTSLEHCTLPYKRVLAASRNDLLQLQSSSSCQASCLNSRLLVLPPPLASPVTTTCHGVATGGTIGQPLLQPPAVESQQHEAATTITSPKSLGHLGQQWDKTDNITIAKHNANDNSNENHQTAANELHAAPIITEAPPTTNPSLAKYETPLMITNSQSITSLPIHLVTVEGDAGTGAAQQQETQSGPASFLITPIQLTPTHTTVTTHGKPSQSLSNNIKRHKSCCHPLPYRLYAQQL